LAQERAAEAAAQRKSRLEEQRQANLAAMKAQYKQEEISATTELLQAARSEDPDISQAAKDQLTARGVSLPEKSLGSLTPYIDPTNPNRRFMLDEKNPEDRRRIREEELQQTTPIREEGGADRFTQDSRQYRQDRITGETLQFFRGQWIPADPEEARAAVERPEAPRDLIRESIGEPRPFDFDIIEAGPGPINRGVAALSRVPVLGQIFTSLDPDFANDERSARLVLENLYSQIRNSAARTLQEGGRLSNLVFELVDKQIPSNGIFTTAEALDTDLNQLHDIFFTTYQSEFNVMNDPGVNPARNQEAENYVTNMGPVIANLEGIILARQFAQTIVNNKPIANYTNQELLNILDDDNNELSRNQILTIARFLQLQGDR
jgi:hypothetical protein